MNSVSLAFNSPFGKGPMKTTIYVTRGWSVGCGGVRVDKICWAAKTKLEEKQSVAPQTLILSILSCSRISFWSYKWI